MSLISKNKKTYFTRKKKKPIQNNNNFFFFYEEKETTGKRRVQLEGPRATKLKESWLKAVRVLRESPLLYVCEAGVWWPLEVATSTVKLVSTSEIKHVSCGHAGKRRKPRKNI